MVGETGRGIEVEAAGVEDLPDIFSLLDENGLPRDGLDEHLETVLVAREGRSIAGSAGLELYGEAALLRSVAVRQNLRGKGLGGRLTREALELARGRGVSRVYLLTETADGFFPRFGFRPIARSLVPDAVRRSVEFVSACPESARAMVAETVAETVADGTGPQMGNAGPTRVLFLCTHNSARSQMAEGLLRHRGGDRFEVFSAGTEATRVRPEAVRAMAELGIDVAGQRSETLDRYLGEPFDYVITVCDEANEACPFFPGAEERLHWSLPDPSRASGTGEQRLDAFRSVRDRLIGRIEGELVNAREAQRPREAP